MTFRDKRAARKHIRAARRNILLEIYELRDSIYELRERSSYSITPARSRLIQCLKFVVFGTPEPLCRLYSEKFIMACLWMRGAGWLLLAVKGRARERSSYSITPGWRFWVWGLVLRCVVCKAGNLEVATVVVYGGRCMACAS